MCIRDRGTDNHLMLVDLRTKDLTGKEADFYGAMDGASKFVKGDAIASIVITVINITAGFAIGVLQKGMDLSLIHIYFAHLPLLLCLGIYKLIMTS